MRRVWSSACVGASAALLFAIGACGDSTGEETSAQSPTTSTSGASTDTDTPPGTNTDPATTNDPTVDPATSNDPTTDPTDTDDSADSSGGGGGPMPSAGCGNAAAPSGSLTMQVDGQTGEYIVSLPAGYDPDTPYPLGFAFHGRNRTGPNCMGGDCAGFQSTMENDAILVYMTSMGGTGWEGPGERELNVTFFDQVLTQLRDEACVDESTIFAAGTSSGAHFTNILGCRYGDQLLAIVPVAGVLPEFKNCVGRTAALVIHGWADPHVPLENGETARDFWRDRNGCSETTDVPIADVHQAVQDTPESSACAAYEGCDAGLPVVWCEHSEGGYDGSTHGWPLFGGQAVWDFVQGL